MTLVVSLTSPEQVVQVSDRRLVWIRGRQIVDEDDDRNKAVVWCNRLTVAYTGLAELGEESRTDLWIADALREWSAATPPERQKQDALIEALPEAASVELSRPPFRAVPRDRKQQAIVGAGWARFNGGSDFEPYIAVVANYRSDSGRPTPAEGWLRPLRA